MLGSSVEDAVKPRFKDVDIAYEQPLKLLTVPGVHIMVPATTERLTYLHKLSEEGPICLSGLSAALDMYHVSVYPLHSVQPVRLDQ